MEAKTWVTLKKEKHYAKKNLLTFLKKKNIKIAFAQQCDKNNLLGNSYREMIRQFLL